MAKPAIKNKRKKRAVKLIKDKAIINFLLEHMKPSKIDFSKVKIPSFFNFLESEGEKKIIQIIQMQFERFEKCKNMKKLHIIIAIK